MVHPYAPVLNPVEFLESYHLGGYSVFIMQAVLAVASQYVPIETLRMSGFPDRTAAQGSFFNKATVFYDSRCEKSQLHMLQGSVILSSTVLPYSLDKDFRYWAMNAARLAVKIGLHKR